MYDFEEFKNVMEQMVKEKFSEGYQVERHKVIKNNQLELDSLVILTEDTNVSPQFYMQQLYPRYEQGDTMEQLVADIVSTYHETAKNNRFDSENLTLEACREQIIYRVVSLEKNEEQLAEVPYIPFMDLAITFHCLMVQDEHGIASFRISLDLMQKWGLDHQTLFTIAQNNTMKRFPISICRMETMLYEFFQQTDHESSLDDIMQTGDENIWGNRAFWAKSREGDPYVLTNSSKINGAAVVLYPQCLQHIGENIGGNYYLLPSSIHEMIIMPENATMSRKELCEMVTEVNAQYVEQDEVLSDAVYYYSCVNKTLQICNG